MRKKLKAEEKPMASQGQRVLWIVGADGRPAGAVRSSFFGILLALYAGRMKVKPPHAVIKQKHPRVRVGGRAMMALLAGAAGLIAVARGAKLQADFLLQVLDLPHGILGTLSATPDNTVAEALVHATVSGQLGLG